MPRATLGLWKGDGSQDVLEVDAVIVVFGFGSDKKDVEDALGAFRGDKPHNFTLIS